MKLRASLRYQLYSYLMPMAIFYGVIIGLNLISVVERITLSNIQISITGTDVSTLIFIFVLGLNSVRESFRMMAVNGRTRKTAFFSIALGTLIASAFMALIDMLIRPVFAPFFDNFNTLYDMLYGRAQGVSGIFVEYGWRVALYTGVALTGVWITTLYYRMNKAGKIGVSVGVPAFLFFALPMLNSANDGIGRAITAVMNAIAAAIKYMFGFGGTVPVPAMFCLWGTILFLIAAGIFWVCIRRAPVRE